MYDSGVELVREVLVRGPIARSQLAANLGLSPSSLTRITRPFTERGLLVERDETRDGSMGRPTRPLEISAEVGVVVGVKLTGALAQLVLSDTGANELARAQAALDSTAPVVVATQLSSLIRDLAARGSRLPLLGVGVCLGGAVSEDGVVHRAPFLGWRNVPFAEQLEAQLALPVVLENDVVALTEAEYLLGRARGISNFAMLTIGAGIGYGLVMHGQVVRSVDAGLGLASHVPLDPTGPLCADGHRGCAQAMLSSESMCAQASMALGRPVDYQELLKLAVAGQEPAETIVAAAAVALGRLIALTANLTMHPTVVLGGEGIGLWTAAEQTICETARELRDPDAQPLDIRVDSSGFEVWARGAAAVAIERSLTRLAD